MFHLTTNFDRNALASHDEKLRLNLYSIERKLVYDLHKFGHKAYCENFKKSEWTKQIKRNIIEIGRDFGFLTFPLEKNDGSFCNEWIFDVVWVSATIPPDESSDHKWHYARSLGLACESEWASGESQILEDFLKLTFCLADLRLFIYTNTMINSSDKNKIHPIELCKRASPLSRGFRYLALGFPETDTGLFQVDAWVA